MSAEPKRILFVDDEKLVLDGLKRMLRVLRSEWDMTFVESAEEALRLLDESRYPFDVLVTDMRMPGMDGAQLLDRVQARHPGVVRLILSGHAELELSMRSATSAHQFLTKPCSSDKIKSVVTRSFELHRRLNSEQLRDVVGKLRTLPTLPSCYSELTRAMADEDVTIQDVADIVARDSAITAKVLQLVSSSFFGIPRTIDSLRDAVGYLGLRNIRALVLQYGIVNEFDPTTAAPGFRIEAHQRHSLEVADLARRMHAGSRTLSEQAFLAGILHDVGELVLATNMPELFERVQRLQSLGRVPAHELERRAIGVSHADVGAYLLGIWGMPDTIVDGALRHHTPSGLPEANDLDVAATVHVADALLDEAARPAGRTRLDAELVARLRLEDRLDEWRRLASEIHSHPPEDTNEAA